MSGLLPSYFPFFANNERNFQGKYRYLLKCRSNWINKYKSISMRNSDESFCRGQGMYVFSTIHSIFRHCTLTLPEVSWTANFLRYIWHSIHVGANFLRNSGLKQTAVSLPLRKMDGFLNGTCFTTSRSISIKPMGHHIKQSGGQWNHGIMTMSWNARVRNRAGRAGSHCIGAIVTVWCHPAGLLCPAQEGCSTFGG